jgi:hypothetical protein
MPVGSSTIYPVRRFSEAGMSTSRRQSKPSVFKIDVFLFTMDR